MGPQKNLLRQADIATTMNIQPDAALKTTTFSTARLTKKARLHFFSPEVFTEICSQLGVQETIPDVTGRNFITASLNLNSSVNIDFGIQGVRFAGVTECSPCHWMDSAIAPGVERLLQRRGGLRTRILTDGILRALR